MLFGEPGVGKGTLGTKLSEKYSIPRLSTGDLFRAEITKGTSQGELVKDFVNKGHLVPDEIVLQVAKQMFSRDYPNGFILDGFPRTVPQGEAFSLMLKEHGWKMDAIILIKVQIEEIIRRLSARRQCNLCGTSFNLVSSPPKTAWICDKCGGKLIQRPDDEPQVVRERLLVYQEQTKAVVDYYTRKGLLKEIDVTGLSIEDSFKKLVDCIDNQAKNI